MSGRGREYPPVAERLAAKTDKNPGHGPNGDCWVWTGYRTIGGYGQIRWPKGDPRGSDYTHRVAYQLHYGIYLDRARTCGVLVLHKCDNPSCVRPDHLFLGDDRINNEDMMRKGRHRTVDQRGSLNHAAKLTEDQVRAIRKDRRHVNAVAETYGVSPGAVYSILSGRNWAHVV